MNNLPVREPGCTGFLGKMVKRHAQRRDSLKRPGLFQGRALSVPSALSGAPRPEKDQHAENKVNQIHPVHVFPPRPPASRSFRGLLSSYQLPSRRSTCFSDLLPLFSSGETHCKRSGSPAPSALYPRVLQDSGGPLLFAFPFPRDYGIMSQTLIRRRCP